MENNSSQITAEPPTYKQKLEILDSLSKQIFDSNRINEYLKLSQSKDLQKPILKRIIEYIIEIDTFISASYEIISEEDWEQICLFCDTPGGSPTCFDAEIALDGKESSKEIKEKLEFLNLYFLPIFKSLETMKIETILDVLSPIFKIKTRNVQFLLFLLAKTYPSQVFGFLIAKLKKDPKNFSPFFASLLVRMKLNPEFKKKCYNAYFRHISVLKPSKSINYLVQAQNFLYIHCFKGFRIDDSSSKIVKMLFNDGYACLMNKNVAIKFTETHNEKIPAFFSYKNDCLFSFPFDLPISRTIADMIREDYVVFE